MEADLTALFERYHQEVYRLCVGMLNNPDEAEDAVQEVFLRAHHTWARYDPQRSAPRTWLGHITINYCRSVLRRRRLGMLLYRLLGTTVFGSDDSLRGHELHADLSNALRLLDERHRSVVLLRYYLDYSCAEIAHILDISEGTVHSRLYTARQRMQALLNEEG